MTPVDSLKNWGCGGKVCALRRHLSNVWLNCVLPSIEPAGHVRPAAPVGTIPITETCLPLHSSSGEAWRWQTIESLQGWATARAALDVSIRFLPARLALYKAASALLKSASTVSEGSAAATPMLT